MLISHKKKFIYTKTVKTAGTSVESFFERYCMPEGDWQFMHHRDEYVSSTGVIGYRGPGANGKEWFNHMTAPSIKSKIGSEQWERYFKFCVIRNPFDKLVSLFFFKIEKGQIYSHKNTSLIRSFNNWIQQDVPLPDREMYTIDGELCLDFFVRYENLEEDVKRVCDRLDIPFDHGNIPTLKSGFRDKSIELHEFYSKESIRMVEEKYAFELNHFSYDKPCIPE